MSISVAVATYNEEYNIRRCLSAVYGWVDEIVIVDGTSSDNTVKIAKSLDKERKLHTIVRENPAMFHKNKQKALDACTKDWILQLDADEVVSDALQKEIKETIKTPKYSAYWVPRLNYFLGSPLKKGGQYPDYTIRLYKNGSAKFLCKSIHEQVEIKGKLGYLKKNLLHYPWSSLKDYIEKALIRYSKLEAKKLLERGVRPSILNGIKYLIILPPYWFIKTYFRHKGFMDGKAGFIFSFMSSLRYWIIYIYLFEKK